MAHSLILGITESGKTTLGKQLAKQYRTKGTKVLTLDELMDPGWEADFVTFEPEQFLDMFWASRNCAAFIDEAGDAVGRYDRVMQRTATKGRHWGHNVHYLSQRGAQLNVTVRHQCSHLFLFSTAYDDAKIHAREWNQPELVEASRLQQGEFFHATRFGQLQRGRVF